MKLSLNNELLWAWKEELFSNSRQAYCPEFLLEELREKLDSVLPGPREYEVIVLKYVP